MEDNGYMFKVVKPEGTWYIRIMAAKVSEVWRDGGKATELVPLVEIASGEDWYGDKIGFITYRGRKYQLDNTVTRLETPRTHARNGRQLNWTTDGYQRTPKNESGSELDWKSPARAKLDAMRDAVLDEWAEENPTWAKLSERRRIEADLSSAESEAKRLLRELNTMEAKVAALRSRLASFRI